jgi:hypothetical protein
MSETLFSWPGRRLNDPRHDRVAAFLMMDIQRSSQWSEDLRVKIDEVRSSVRTSWERIGNAYRLQLSAAGAWIDDLVDPTSVPQTVSLAEFDAAVQAWIQTIARTPGCSALPEPGDEQSR